VDSRTTKKVIFDGLREIFEGKNTWHRVRDTDGLAQMHRLDGCEGSGKWGKRG